MPGYTTAMRRYFTFSGRSTRAEFWHFTLVSVLLLGSFAQLLDYLVGSYHRIFFLVFFVHLIPSLAVSARRLHDINRTGWWYLLVFTVIGVIPLIELYCERGTAGPNRYGEPDSDAGLQTSPQHLPGAVPLGSPAARDATAELERLAVLRLNGSLTEAEFASLKAQILRQGPSAPVDASL